MYEEECTWKDTHTYTTRDYALVPAPGCFPSSTCTGYERTVLPSTLLSLTWQHSAVPASSMSEWIDGKFVITASARKTLKCDLNYLQILYQQSSIRNVLKLRALYIALYILSACKTFLLNTTNWYFLKWVGCRKKKEMQHNQSMKKKFLTFFPFLLLFVLCKSNYS